MFNTSPRHTYTYTDDEIGTMNCIVSFALLVALPASGSMLDTMGAQALAGLLMAIVFIGGVCFFAARALLIGQWVAFKTKI